MTPNIIGPDGLDLGPPNYHRKFRWVARLYRDAKQIHHAEFIRVDRRPSLTIAATSEMSWNCGGEIEITFFRKNIETCDEIWLGLYDGVGNAIEEWELCEVNELPPEITTRELWINCDYDNDIKIKKFDYKHMRYKHNGKWTNWSVI